jgi:hypothetical protein
MGVLGGGLGRPTTRVPPAILPNLGGSLPNDIFAVDLGLTTVWAASDASHLKHTISLASIKRRLYSLLDRNVLD